MSPRKPVALITGVGPGTGQALVRQFAAQGYAVAMLARNAERLAAIAHELDDCHAYPVDVSDTPALNSVLGRIDQELGAAEILVHNAVGGTFGAFREIQPEQLQHNFSVNVMALLHLARHCAPAMIAAGRGCIIATGNTSAWRGKSHFAGFAPSKAAQRILMESIARDLGPQGIHVAYLTIDAVIDVPWTRKLHSTAADDFFIQPADIAAEVWRLSQQPRSAWSFNAEVRPYAESW